ncbi:MAG: hypothetical protein JST55_14005 [Bacteroidetes bacterium]|nr:hypothetical protein [Bacteroidota bacterium]
MKNSKRTIIANLLAVISFFTFITANVNAQNAETFDGKEPKTTNSLYVVLQRSDMCEMMNDNYTRWNTEVVNYYSDRPSIVFLSYDITDENTIDATKTDVQNYGLLYLLNANKAPGRVFLIDPNHQQIVNMLDVHLTSEELKDAISKESPYHEQAEAGF